MKKIFFLFGLLLVAACSGKKEIPEILSNKFETQIIPGDSSGPAVDLESGRLKKILVLLHNNFPEEEIKKYFGMKDDEYKSAINDLYGEGLVKKSGDGKFVPACMVIDIENGKQLKKSADSLGREMSLIAIDRIGKIKEVYGGIAAFKNIPFDEASLFILGNAVYNFWQIPFINEKFLKADPPRRGTGRYYLALLEQGSGEKGEPFGLFSNKFKKMNNYTAGFYGSDLGDTGSFPVRAGADKGNKNNRALPVRLTPADQKKLSAVASAVTPDIIAYLEKSRTLFVKLYLNSVYKDQASFREWFVWYYQFIISQSARTLAEKGYIKNSGQQRVSFIFAK